MSCNNTECHGKSNDLYEEVNKEHIQINQDVWDHCDNWAEGIPDFQNLEILDQR